MIIVIIPVFELEFHWYQFVLNSLFLLVFHQPWYALSLTSSLYIFFHNLTLSLEFSIRSSKLIPLLSLFLSYGYIYLRYFFCAFCNFRISFLPNFQLHTTSFLLPNYRISSPVCWNSFKIFFPSKLKYVSVFAFFTKFLIMEKLKCI